MPLPLRRPRCTSCTFAGQPPPSRLAQGLVTRSPGLSSQGAATMLVNKGQLRYTELRQQRALHCILLHKRANEQLRSLTSSYRQNRKPARTRTLSEHGKVMLWQDSACIESAMLVILSPNTSSPNKSFRPATTSALGLNSRI